LVLVLRRVADDERVIERHFELVLVRRIAPRDREEAELIVRCGDHVRIDPAAIDEHGPLAAGKALNGRRLVHRQVLILLFYFPETWRTISFFAANVRFFKHPNERPRRGRSARPDGAVSRLCCWAHSRSTF